ncbi:MAG: hypothetical protein AAGJ35_08490 [Myxococcota bacterium]
MILIIEMEAEGIVSRLNAKKEMARTEKGSERSVGLTRLRESSATVPLIWSDIGFSSGWLKSDADPTNWPLRKTLMDTALDATISTATNAESTWALSLLRRCRNTSPTDTFRA